MPYAPGQSGNPKGRPLGTKNHISRELEKIVQANGGKVAREIAQILVDMTLKRDMQAGRLVLERLEGRVATADELAKRAGATETPMAPDQFEKKLIDLLRQPKYSEIAAKAALPATDSVQ